MCMLVIAGTDEPMSPVRPDDAFLFQVKPLYPDSAPVQRLFSKPHIYDLSSVGGCGCGFHYSPQDLELQAEATVPDDIKAGERESHAQRRESVRLLQQFLRQAAGSGSVELYSCWIGDENDEPETRLTVELAHFDGEDFDLVERQFLTVARGAG